MNEIIALSIILLVIVAIAFIRKHKRIAYPIFGLIVFVVVPLFAPGLFMPILGATVLLMFWDWRMKS